MSILIIVFEYLFVYSIRVCVFAYIAYMIKAYKCLNRQEIKNF